MEPTDILNPFGTHELVKVINENKKPNEWWKALDKLPPRQIFYRYLVQLLR